MKALWVSPLVIVLACGLYGLLHSWLASKKIKAQIENRLGNIAERSYRFVYNVIAVLGLAPVLILPAVLPDHRLYSIPVPWVFLTLAIQAAAGLMLLAGLFQTGLLSFLGIRQLIQEPRASDPGLVTHGLYHRVRHPLYSAGFILLWLMPVMTVNLLALNLGLSTYLVVGAFFEERKLEHEFGDAYRQYRRQTPMFIPRIHLK